MSLDRIIVDFDASARRAGATGRAGATERAGAKAFAIAATPIARVEVMVFDAGGVPVLFDEEFRSDPDGTVRTLVFSPGRAELTIAATPGDYTFRSRGFNADGGVIAGGEQRVTLGGLRPVSLELTMLLGEVEFKSARPDIVATRETLIDLLLIVNDVPKTGRVPLGDYSVDYSVRDNNGFETAIIVAATNRGIRLIPSQDESIGWVEVVAKVTGVSVLATGELGVRVQTVRFEFAIESPETIGFDFNAPMLTIDPIANATAGSSLSVEGTATDNVGVERIDVFEGPVLLASSNREAIAADGALPISVVGTSWTFDWSPTAVRDYALTAVASDATGNSTEVEQLVSVGEPGGGEAPPAPASVQAVAAMDQITVTWIYDVGVASTFRILRSETTPGVDPSEFRLLVEVDGDTTYADKAVVVGVLYRYAVVAVGGDGAVSDMTEQAGPAVQLEMDGTPSPCRIVEPFMLDSDGDGLLDLVETTGWTVTVTDGNELTTSRAVVSDPNNPDSNGDGLCDAEAARSFLDPSVPGGDTDGDGLTDLDELRTWASTPTDVDSDNDSEGNPALFDGNEVFQSTSPTLEDSDGDGISDHEEILVRGNVFDPLVANVPQLELSLLGTAAVDLDVTISEEDGTDEVITTALEQSTSSDFSASDSMSHEATANLSTKIGNSASVGFSEQSPEIVYTATFEVEASAGYTYNTSTSTTRASGQASRDSYQEAVTKSRVEGRSISGGTLRVSTQIRNTGALSFSLSDVLISALLREPGRDAGFTPLTSLVLPPEVNLGAVLAPGDVLEPIIATGNLTADQALAVLANPEQLILEFSNATLQYQNPEPGAKIPLLDFNFLREGTGAQTALIQIDYGNGNVRRPRVATNVRRVGGQIAGVMLGEALRDILDIEFEMAAIDNAESDRLLVQSIRDNQNRVDVVNQPEDKRLWAVGVKATNDQKPVLIEGVDFDKITLQGGDSAFLMFVTDFDDDGVFAREEYLAGTSDQDSDSDNDGLSDFEELKEGWNVPARVDPYVERPRVFSNPRNPDADLDGLDDVQERAAATDPNMPDTDGDSFCDGPGSGGDRFQCRSSADPDPLDPSITGNQPPSIEGLSVDFRGFDATLSALVADPEADLEFIRVEWGDGTGDELPPSVGQATATHVYPRNGTFLVTLIVEDVFGEIVRAEISATVELPTGGEVATLLYEPTTNNFLRGNHFGIADGCGGFVTDRFGFGERAFRFTQESSSACGLDATAYSAPPISRLVGDFSIAMWIRPALALDDRGDFIAGFTENRGANNNTDVPPGAHFNRRGFGVRGAGEVQYQLTVPSTAPPGVSPVDFRGWTFYTGVVTSAGTDSTVIFYRDGVEVDRRIVPGLVATGRANEFFYVGNEGGVPGNDYYGGVDDVRIFNRALSASEVRVLFLDGT